MKSGATDHNDAVHIDSPKTASDRGVSLEENMRNKLPDWINIKIVIAVASTELAFVILEGWYIIRCHYTGSECWPWFFTMIANFPASIGIFKFVGFIYDSFHVESFWTQITLMAGSFLIIGTLWWSLVLHGLIIFYKYTSRFVADRK